MVNSRQKGIRGEQQLIKYLQDKTGHLFLQTPGSGSGRLKGDLYNPKLNVCIECKFYKEDPLASTILCNASSVIPIWWKKLVGESKKKTPLLFYKWNRSKWFIAIADKPRNTKKFLDFPSLGCYILLADEYFDKEQIDWI